MVEKEGEEIVDKENLRRGLRKELIGSGKIYRNLADRNAVSPKEGGAYPYLVQDAEGVEYAGDGRLLVGSLDDPERSLVMVDENGEILWKKALGTGSLFTSIERKGKTGNFIMIVREESGGTRYVREYDVHGNLVNEVSDSTLGLAAVNRVVWDLRDPDHFWVSSVVDDKVVKTSWDAEIDKSITNVEAPTDIDYHLGKLWICDSANNRVVQVNEDGSIHRQYPFPLPIAVQFNGQIALIGGSRPHSGHRCGVWAFQHNASAEALGFIPIKGDVNAVNFHPTAPNRVLLVASGTVLDMDISYLWRGHTDVPPLSYRPWEGKSIAADSPETTIPSLDWLHPDKTIHVKATQSGTVTIQKANYKDTYGFWDGTWSKFDDFSISADTAEEYRTKHLLGAFRVKVDLDADGEADLWVHQR